jgi:hypothetical protein
MRASYRPPLLAHSILSCLLVAALAASCDRSDGEEKQSPAGEEECREGRVRGEATAGHCCWPGQKWSDPRESCAGAPASCPPGHEPRAERETCADLCSGDSSCVESLDACLGDDMAACHRLAMMYDPIEGSLERDDDLRARFARESCEGGHMPGCTHLGRLYEGGRGVDKNMPRSRELFEEACEGGDPRGCVDLGYALTYTEGIHRDPERGRELFAKACRQKLPRGCTRLAFAHRDGLGGKRDTVRARELFAQACEMGGDTGCGVLGFMLERGQGGPEDLERARA